MDTQKMLKQKSYLLLGFGRSYIEDSKDLIDTLRHFKDDTEVNIVVDSRDYNYACNLKLFNNVIIFNVHEHPFYPRCKTKFEKFCLLPRLELYKFLNTEYTIVLDTDILCAYRTNNVWDYLIQKKQDLIMLGSKNNPSWHWGNWAKICSKINIQPQETHGGLFFLRDTPNLKNIFKDAEYAFLNYDKLGMLKRYQGGAVDEPCFAYAFSKNNLSPVEFSEFPIMTFNIDSSQPIPTRLLTEQRQYGYFTKGYIPFIHMFEKNHASNFKLLKNKILQFKY